MFEQDGPGWTCNSAVANDWVMKCWTVLIERLLESADDYLMMDDLIKENLLINYVYLE